MYRMTDDEFTAAIEEALDAMPEQFLQALENVAVVWEYEPNDYHLGCLPEDGEFPAASEGFGDGEDFGEGQGEPAKVDWKANLQDTWKGEDDGGWDEWDAEEGDYEPLPDDLLGLFDGLSLVERAEGGYDDDIPDVITVFKGPHERCFNSREEIVEEIGKTVIHELGHYFGLDDDRLYEMGY